LEGTKLSGLKKLSTKPRKPGTSKRKRGSGRPDRGLCVMSGAMGVNLKWTKVDNFEHQM